MLYAHWDARPFADSTHPRTHRWRDDGASGVGVLLEVARQLGLKSADVGVDIVFFDAEDYGRPAWIETTEGSFRDWCLGSQFWAQNPHVPRYRARFGLLLDMVGAADARFHQEGTSLRYAPNVVRKVWRRAELLGFGDRFSSEATPQTIDDNLFVSDMAGIPSANIVDYRIKVRPMGYGPFHPCRQHEHHRPEHPERSGVNRAFGRVRTLNHPRRAVKNEPFLPGPSFLPSSTFGRCLACILRAP